MEDSLEERESIDVSQGIKNPHSVSRYYEVWDFHESEIVTLSANGPTFLLEFSHSASPHPTLLWAISKHSYSINLPPLGVY